MIAKKLEEYKKEITINKEIRLGIIGGGGDSLIGILHRVASSMFDKYEIVGGVFNPNWEENICFSIESKIGYPNASDALTLLFGSHANKPRNN